MDIDSLESLRKVASAERLPYEKVWEDIGWFIHRRMMNFQGDYTPGDFVTFGGVYDTTAQRASRLLASALSGMLWRNGARTFRIRKPKYLIEDSEIHEFYEYANWRLITDMEHPKAGLTVALDEYFHGQTTFSTSGTGVYRGKESFFSFVSRDVKHCKILENARGIVDTMFFERQLSASDIVKEYGWDKVSAKVAKAAAGKSTEKYTIVQAVLPNDKYDPAEADMDSRRKAWASIHYELETKSVLRESGFDEMPDKFCRMYKVTGEVYGRSPSTEAMPAVWEVNKVVEQLHQATELQLKPPLAFLDNGTFGGGSINLSPNGWNVINVSGRLTGANPIQPLVSVGELNTSYQLWAELQKQIAEMYLLDKIFDLNANQRMTLGEAQIRNELRSEPLAPIFARQISEHGVPVIERCVNLEMAENRFGYIRGSMDAQIREAMEASRPERNRKPIRYIPDAVAELMLSGEDWYEVDMISPAARIMRSEELRGTLSAYEFAASTSARMALKFDESKLADHINTLSGVPEGVQKSEDIYIQDIKAYEEAQTVAAQQTAAETESKINKNNAGAAQSRAQAQTTAGMVGIV